VVAAVARVEPRAAEWSTQQPRLARCTQEAEGGNAAVGLRANARSAARRGAGQPGRPRHAAGLVTPTDRGIPEPPAARSADLRAGAVVVSRAAAGFLRPVARYGR